jgi:hypothetical protein
VFFAGKVAKATENKALNFLAGHKRAQAHEITGLSDQHKERLVLQTDADAVFAEFAIAPGQFERSEAEDAICGQ